MLMLKPPPDYPVKLVQRLVGGLDSLGASFRTISSSFDVVNFYESSKHPLVRSRKGDYRASNKQYGIIKLTKPQA